MGRWGYQPLPQPAWRVLSIGLSCTLAGGGDGQVEEGADCSREPWALVVSQMLSCPTLWPKPFNFLGLHISGFLLERGYHRLHTH